METYKDYLTEIYYDSGHPAAFSGEEKLYREVKKEGRYRISRNKIRNWLQEQETFSVHKQSRNKFPRRKVIATYIDYQWDADTAIFDSYKSSNNGYTCFLLVIDIFSRFVWTRPLKTRKGVEMTSAFRSIFQSGRKPHVLRTDKGSEFVNTNVNRLLKSQKIKHFVTQNSVKASYAERAIKTIKSKLVRIMTHRQSRCWINDLNAITQSYNNTYHRTIEKTPASVTNEDRFNFWRAQEKERDNNPEVKGFKFKTGDIVRITYIRNVFSREYDERWTRELFIITSRFTKDGRCLYTLKDYDNEPILGTFYQEELQKVRVNNNTVYKVEKVLRRRMRNNRREVMVKWLGWPNKFNSWILQSQLKKL